MSNYCATNYSLPAAAAGSVEPVSKDAAGRLPALLPPALVTGYAGRVSTFYNDTQATYSETYEPVRQTSVGDVWRVESRFISDRWLHLAYSFKGNQISFPDGGIGMFEQGDLPLLFDPLVERQYGLDVYKRQVSPRA